MKEKVKMTGFWVQTRSKILVMKVWQAFSLNEIIVSNALCFIIVIIDDIIA